MKTHIFCGTDEHGDPLSYATDTAEEIRLAREALWAAGKTSAPVYVGEPDGLGDTDVNGQAVYAADYPTFAAYLREYRAARGGPSVGPNPHEIAEWVIGLGARTLPDKAASFVFSRYGSPMLRATLERIARSL